MDFLREFFHALFTPEGVEGLISWGGLTVLNVIVFAETGLMVGFFLPGDSLLVTAGLFAARGNLDIVWLNVTLIASAIAGDAVGFWTGAKAGPLLYAREDSRFFKKKHLLRAREFYEKHGGKTIILARFVPFVRTFAPIVAGAAQMPYRRFLAYNVFGGAGWILSMTMLGYALGRIWPDVVKKIHLLAIVIIFVSMIPIFIEWRRARREAKSS